MIRQSNTIIPIQQSSVVRVTIQRGNHEIFTNEINNPLTKIWNKYLKFPTILSAGLAALGFIGSFAIFGDKYFESSQDMNEVKKTILGCTFIPSTLTFTGLLLYKYFKNCLYNNHGEINNDNNSTTTETDYEENLNDYILNEELEPLNDQTPPPNYQSIIHQPPDYEFVNQQPPNYAHAIQM